MKKSLQFSLLIVAQLNLPLFSSAQGMPISLPDLLSDHAVLQKNSLVNFWGKGPAGQKLKIVASWNPKDTTEVMIGNDCMWQTQIQTPSSNSTFSIKFIANKDIKQISDVLLGDVWLCSGQSNMEFNMHWGIDTTQPKYQIATNNKIRFFQVERNFDKLPVSDLKGKWIICDPNTAKNFSTVGYFFGKKIQSQTQIPIGLIGSYWGGTNIQAWMPKSSFERPDLDPATMHMDPYEGCPRGYSILYNAMIHPLLNYKIKGCLWYQGETNADYDWNKYGTMLSSMINAWRFGMNDNFPFYTIQIAAWNGYKEHHAAYLREEEANLGNKVPNYGSISILDLIDDTTNLHPKIKMEVGDRMANLILHDIYHENINATPPTILNVELHDQKAIVKYQSQAKALTSTNKSITGFEVAGSDHIFYKATAVLEKGKQIILSAPEVPSIQYVRYCFQNASVPNLFDNNGLPLASWRSDHLVETE